MAQVVQFPDELYTQIAAYAAQQHETPDEVILSWVREAAQQVKAQAAPATQEEPVYDPATDPLSPFIGQFHSGDPLLAERHHEYLADDHG